MTSLRISRFHNLSNRSGHITEKQPVGSVNAAVLRVSSKESLALATHTTEGHVTLSAKRRRSVSHVVHQTSTGGSRDHVVDARHAMAMIV